MEKTEEETGDIISDWKKGDGEPDDEPLSPREDLQNLGYYIKTFNSKTPFNEVIENIRDSLKIIQRLLDCVLPQER